MGHVEGQLVAVTVTGSHDIFGVSTLVQIGRVALSGILEGEHIAVAVITKVGIIEQFVIAGIHHSLSGILGDGKECCGTRSVVVMELLPCPLIKCYTGEQCVGSTTRHASGFCCCGKQLSCKSSTHWSMTSPRSFCA